MFVIVYFTPLLLFVHQTEAAVAAFTSEPSSPSFVIEKHNLTLTWKYTLGGTVLLARFINITGGGREEFIRKVQGGSANVIVSSYEDRFSAGISDTQAWLKILRVQRSDQGKYEFDVAATGSGSINSEVEVIVQSPANFINVSGNQSVREGLNLQLFCEASGKPEPNITWAIISQSGSESGILNRGSSWDIENISRTDAGTYRCKASNGVGNQVTHAIEVTVLFPPNITLQNESYVGREKSVSLHCQNEGYPPPTITWKPCNPQENVCFNSRLNISKVQRDAVYNCAVKNNLGNASASTSLIIGAKKINLTLSITIEKCPKGDTSFSSTWDKLRKAVDEIFDRNNDYVDATLLDWRCGSLSVDLSLEFTSVVSEAWVLSTLRIGIIDGKLGELPVNASSIVGIPVVESTATPPTSKTTTKPPDDENIALIVGCAVGGFILLVIIIAVVIWCVRKNNNKDKRKKSKTSNKEVGDNDAEGQRMSQLQGGHPTPGHGNNGYENTGSMSRPPAANAGKKDKKVKKKHDEPEKPVGVVYAQVDKSKKTAKPKEPETLYDQATRPNSKRPGELQYIAPEDLHQGHSMPRNSAAQPKKPEAYTETQYAVLV